MRHNATRRSQPGRVHDYEMPVTKNWDKWSDEDLIKASRREPDAFGEFYDRHEAPLLAFLVRATGQPHAAAEIAAETFAALLVSLHNGREVDEPRAWLYSVAKRKVVDAARRGVVANELRRRLSVELDSLSEDSIERIGELADDGHPLALKALAGLPEEQRAAVKARVLDELSYDEIAAALNCGPATARKRVSRGLAQIRRTLQEANQ